MLQNDLHARLIRSISNFINGGSSSIRQTTIMPGSKVTLKLTNKAGAGKDISVGVYFTEIEV